MPMVTFSGLASGIDSDALIEAMSDAAREARVVPWEKRVSELEETNASLDELSTKFADLQSMIRSFATINGGPVAKEATSGNESVVTATASNAASNGSYQITVNALARNGTLTFDTGPSTYTTPDAIINSGMFTGGAADDHSVVIPLGQGTYAETVTVVLDQTTTLSEFVTDFNNQATLATASIINIGTSSSPDYRIMITSQNEGLEKGTVGPAVIGVDVGALDPPTTSAAADANFTIAGVGIITRSSNTVGDLIPGVTFQLNATSTSAVTINVLTDADTTAQTANDFVEAFNDIVSFLKENNLIEREQEGSKVTNTFGSLAKTRVDDNALTSIRSQISAASADNNSTIAIFADLGITTERDGTLKFNEDTFKSALGTDAKSVQEMMQSFADVVSLTGGTIDQYIRFNGLFDVTITGNEESITNLNDRIARAEEAIEKTATLTRKRFSQLEAIMARMQTQQQGLASALGQTSK